jgi:hypothetical protein
MSIVMLWVMASVLMPWQGGCCEYITQIYKKVAAVRIKESAKGGAAQRKMAILKGGGWSVVSLCCVS